MGLPPPLGCKVRKMGGTCRQLLLLFAMGITAILGSEAEMTSANTACTTAQNTVKTDTAQAVLDCGTNKCGKVTGNEQQACLCKDCKTLDQAAQSASCACGMSDANSAAACQIYQRLNAKCSSVARLSLGLSHWSMASLFATITLLMQRR